MLRVGEVNKVVRNLATFRPHRLRVETTRTVRATHERAGEYPEKTELLGLFFEFDELFWFDPAGHGEVSWARPQVLGNGDDVGARVQEVTKRLCHFFTLFTPPGVHWIGKVLLFPIEFISFMVRPFSLGLRPFIAMFAGHILVDIFGNFIVQGLQAGGGGIGVSILAFFFVAFINILELLVAAIQAYVFAILTALYINDAVNLH